jgi:hypothetical protein
MGAQGQRQQGSRQGEGESNGNAEADSAGFHRILVSVRACLVDLGRRERPSGVLDALLPGWSM